ncbi:hypothetical protein [Streptomyces wuyuanensis]|uniref:hypothetical protein n=1 Tax=Streptomyces wuyuanensis TaxID=1196353 RepID=UPI00343183C1
MTPPAPRLTYSISPATADTSTTTPQTIKITATSDNQNTSITSLTFTLPKGTSEKDLTDEDLTNSNIKVTQGWEGDTTTTNNTCKIELTPEDDPPIPLDKGQSLTLTITLTPTKKAGIATLNITETTRAGGQQQVAHTTLTITKTGGAYSFNYFAPEHINVAYNGETTLHWEASGIANYTLNYDNEHITITNGEQKTYPIKNITHPTSYSLQANPKKPIPGATNPTLTTTITIDHPDITTNNLTITGTARIKKLKTLQSYRMRHRDLAEFTSSSPRAFGRIDTTTTFAADAFFSLTTCSYYIDPNGGRNRGYDRQYEIDWYEAATRWNRVASRSDGTPAPGIADVCLQLPSGEEVHWDPAIQPISAFVPKGSILRSGPTKFTLDNFGQICTKKPIVNITETSSIWFIVGLFDTTLDLPSLVRMTCYNRETVNLA